MPELLKALLVSASLGALLGLERQWSGQRHHPKAETVASVLIAKHATAPASAYEPTSQGAQAACAAARWKVPRGHGSGAAKPASAKLPGGLANWKAFVAEPLQK
jgi:hypothetical protein